MNLVRPAGAAPAAPFRILSDSPRAGVFACAGVLAALNAQAAQLLDALNNANSFIAIADLAGISGLIWFAMYAALRIGFEGTPTSLTRVDLLLVGATVLLSLLPVAAGAKAALEICAIYAVIIGRDDRAVRRVGIVLLGLTGPLIWGRVILDTFAISLLSADAHLVAAAIGTPVHGNIVQFANGQGQFLVGMGCSSVHNISLAIVLWTTAAALFGVRLDVRYLTCGLLMMGFMFGLNIVRLSSIGLFPDSFSFLHDGLGAELFGWTALIGAGVIAFGGIRSAVARQR